MPSKVDKLITWIKKRSQPCPICGGKVRPSIIRWTAWCPNCHQYWMVKTLGRTRWWHYIYEPIPGVRNRMASVPAKLKEDSDHAHAR